MFILERSARRLSIVGAVISGLAAVAVSTTVGAGPARALPPGDAFCSSVPVDSRLDIECTNTDVGPATVGVIVTCSNLRPLVQEVRMRPESTIQFSEDCGPGAHPISWNVGAKTDYQRDRERDYEIDHERNSGHEHI
ncbi:hypothetical protein [Nocardia brevicatena]|uniref:hypothetical protein n=1 Tax=Nocardia brevicatena TaxID=37327 RepID=UPI0003143EED|nr:hypothetical protein [Nocardia brevicatena]